MKGVILAFLALAFVSGAYYLMATSHTKLNFMATKRIVATPTPTSANPTILLTSGGFVPATLTIKTGDTVIWKNESGAEAAIDSDPHPTHTSYPPMNLGNVANGSQVTLKFDKAGTYHYHNHLNPVEKGTIEVK